MPGPDETPFPGGRSRPIGPNGHEHDGHEHNGHQHDGHQHDGHDHDGHDHGSHGAAAAPVGADASVREARVNDLAALGRVQAAVWRDAYGSVLSQEVLDRLDPQAFAAGWRPGVQSPPSERHRLLVALAGGQVLGLAAVVPSADPDSTSDAAELVVLGVHPDARRQGHGSRLLNAAMGALQDLGVTQVRAWVLADHDATRSFLAAGGFAPDGAHRSRVVDPSGRAARELRLSAELAPAEQP